MREPELHAAGHVERLELGLVRVVEFIGSSWCVGWVYLHDT